MVHVGVDLHKRVSQIAVLTGDRGGRSTRPDDGNLKENRPVHCKKTGGPQPRVLATPAFRQASVQIVVTSRSFTEADCRLDPHRRAA